eukprot:TRINITY_DN13485_c0_g1_i2.p1 TRINITY_DN13485_c0_g1~~TRINITY_DN13485_c0_g1_i2.p1  ORF type:complete len:885 (-),score=86.37 TRINITY_DN13485_c0_g1_i2:276-2840(-)
MQGADDVDDANVEAGLNEHEGEFEAWIDAADESKPVNPTYDSDCDSDEARDGFAELPISFDTTMSVMFLVDVAKHMSYVDVHGSEQSRIDTVIGLIKQFVVQQRKVGAVSDRYTLVSFGVKAETPYNNTNFSYEVLFQNENSENAVLKLSGLSIVARWNSNYSSALEAISNLTVRGQRTRVILLADANPNDLFSCTLPQLQGIIANNPTLDIHTIGLGTGDFSVLQQIAQIGRGTFICTSMDMDRLSNTFTSVSKTLTQTRAVDFSTERPIRDACFESARKGKTKGGAGFNFKNRSMAAERLTFYLQGRSMIVKERTRTTCQIRKDPFMLGGMRLVYRFKDLEMDWLLMVAKKSKYAVDDHSAGYVRTFVHNTLQARFYSKHFHEAVWAAFGSWREPRRLVSIAQCFAYTSEGSWFVAEPFLKGSEGGFFKWVNNRGEVLVPKDSCQYSMAAESFAHFSLDTSRGKHMVSDVQGVLRGGTGALRSISLTDPQMLSLSRSFGAADLGVGAMQRFRAMHICNNLCHRLQLSSTAAIPQVPRVHATLCMRHDKLPVRKSRPEVIPPAPSVSNVQNERGGSPHASGRRGRSPGCVSSGKVRSKKAHETVSAEQLLFLGGVKPRRLLFVGEYTHSFSAAAAAFVTARVQTKACGADLNWWSTALNWPESSRIVPEMNKCRDFLDRHGVKVMRGIDATNIQLELEGLHGAIWVMAFPHNMADRSSSAGIRASMHDHVERFVKSVARRLDRGFGRVGVIFMAMQHLAWKLPCEIVTSHGVFMREVFWFELEPFVRHGYQPRFGDTRDASRDPTYHTNDEVVIAQWRLKGGASDHPGGMTDQRVRSLSAGRRSRSSSRGPCQ